MSWAKRVAIGAVLAACAARTLPKANLPDEPVEKATPSNPQDSSAPKGTPSNAQDARGQADAVPPVDAQVGSSPGSEAQASPPLEARILEFLGDAARPPAPIATNGSAAARAAAASNRFGLDLYMRVRRAHGNVVFSPASLALVLAMASSGARGATLAEMARVLHIESMRDPDAAFGQLLALTNGLDGKDGLELHVANRLWQHGGNPFESDYVDRMRTEFGALVVDVHSAAEINAWAAAETHGRIPWIVQSLGPMDRLLLTNAIYFNGKWARRFAKTVTTDEEFYAPAKPTKVPMMSQMETVAYAHLDGVQVIDLPYRGGLSMLVALPDARNGLAALEGALAQDYDNWQAAFHYGSMLVDLKLPRWRTTWEGELTSSLEAMGLVQAFRSDRADFAGICRATRLAISGVFQKAFLDVNEEGTEAAAATAIPTFVTSAPQVAVFHADHPFVYVIRERETGAILFMGRVVNPAE
jgi:serpin B